MGPKGNPINSSSRQDQQRLFEKSGLMGREEKVCGHKSGTSFLFNDRLNQERFTPILSLIPDGNDIRAKKHGSLHYVRKLFRDQNSIRYLESSRII